MDKFGLKTVLFDKIGVLLIKPDAVGLGIAEYIIDHIATLLYKKGIGRLKGVFIISSIRKDYLPKIYPELEDEFYEPVAKYLSSDFSVLVTFYGEKKMQYTIKGLRGKRMLDWSDSELNGSKGMNDGVRYMLPVPGTKKIYENVIKGIKNQKQDANLRFTDEEFYIYCQNLVHVPDRLEDTLALLKLLTIGQIYDALGKSIADLMFNEKVFYQ